MTYYDTDGETVLEVQSVIEGETAIPPTTYTIDEGKEFTGWYTTRTGSTVATFENITEDSSFYARQATSGT